MKTAKKLALAFVVVASIASTSLYAQNKKGDRPEGKKDSAEWKAKMESAKKDFFTKELNLSDAELQKFMPVFNANAEARGKAFKEAGEAFEALDNAVKNGQPTEQLLNAYIKAQQRVGDLYEEAAAAYKKILPADKVAKIMVIDEHFRRHMLERLGGGHGPGPGPEGPHPGKAPEGERPQKPEGGHPHFGFRPQMN